MICIYYLLPVQRLDGWLDHAHPSVFSPVASQGGGTQPNGDQWVTSTPSRRDSEPISFDGGRVRAWLGGQSPAPPERRTSCSKSVQTDGEMKVKSSSVSLSKAFFATINLSFLVSCISLFQTDSCPLSSVSQKTLRASWTSFPALLMLQHRYNTGVRDKYVFYSQSL